MLKPCPDMATCATSMWRCSPSAFPHIFLLALLNSLTPRSPLTHTHTQVDTLDVVKQVAGPRWTMWQWAQYWAARQQQGPLLAAEVQVPQALHAGIMTDQDDDSGDEVDSAFVRG